MHLHVALVDCFKTGNMSHWNVRDQIMNLWTSSSKLYERTDSENWLSITTHSPSFPQRSHTVMDGGVRDRERAGKSFSATLFMQIAWHLSLFAGKFNRTCTWPMSHESWMESVTKQQHIHIALSLLFPLPLSRSLPFTEKKVRISTKLMQSKMARCLSG